MQVWGPWERLPQMELLPCVVFLGDSPTHQFILPAYTSEIPEAERMGTWAHGQKASRCHPIPLHLNVLDLGDAPSEKELDANR